MGPQAGAAHPWHARVKMGFLLEEVAVGLGHLLGVVGGARSGAAGGTDDPAADGEADEDVEPAHHATTQWPAKRRAMIAAPRSALGRSGRAEKRLLAESRHTLGRHWWREAEMLRLEPS